MKTASLLLTAAFLSVIGLAATGCSGIAVGTGVPGSDAGPASADEPQQNDLVSSADAGTPTNDAAVHSDASAPKPATKPATFTAFIDGKSSKIDGTASRVNGEIQANINYAADIYGLISVSARFAGSGCSVSSGNTFYLVDFSSSGENFFQPEQPDGACGLVVTDAGTRIVGSFQGTVTNAGKAVKHTVGLSFDIPVE